MYGSANPTNSARNYYKLAAEKVDGILHSCSREDSTLHGLPHTVLSRTRLTVPPRERGGQSYQTNSRSQPGKEFRSYRSSGVQEKDRLRGRSICSSELPNS